MCFSSGRFVYVLHLSSGLYDDVIMYILHCVTCMLYVFINFIVSTNQYFNISVFL